MLATFLLALATTATSPQDPHFVRTRLDMRVAEAVLVSYRENVGALSIEDKESVLLDSFDEDLDSTFGWRLPAKDAWDRPFRCWNVGGSLVITSDGPDGTQSFQPSTDYGVFSRLGDDLVLSGGKFSDPSDTTKATLGMLRYDFMRYANEKGVYPGPTNGLVPLSTIADDIEEVTTLKPDDTDAWGNPILVYSDPAGYLLVSFGADGVADTEWDPSKTGRWPTEAPASSGDIVVVNGRMLKPPE